MNKKIIVIIVTILVIIFVGYLFVKNNPQDIEQQASNDATNAIDSTPLTEEQFKNLLSVDEIQEVLKIETSLNPEFINLYLKAEEVLPSQVEPLDSWFGTNYKSPDTINELKFSVTDYNSETITPLKKQLEKFSGTFQVGKLDDIVIGDLTYGGIINEDTIGSVILYSHGDKMVLMLTEFVNNEPPLTDFDGLIKLAKIVNERL